MLDIFTFANTTDGEQRREALASLMVEHGRECRKFEETWTDGNQSTTVLRLEVTKRLDEGQIAAQMKIRKGRQ